MRRSMVQERSDSSPLDAAAIRAPAAGDAAPRAAGDPPADAASAYPVSRFTSFLDGLILVSKHDEASNCTDR